MEKIAKKIAEKLVERKVVDGCDQEFYCYAIESFLLYLFNLLVVGIVAISLGKVIECCVFLLFYYPLRTYCGGIHMGRWYTCCIVSCYIVGIILQLSGYISINWISLIGVMTVSEVCIWRLAPCEHVNHPIEQEQMKLYRKKARVYSAVVWGIIICLKVLGVETGVVLGWCAGGVNMVLLVFGVL